MDPTSVQQSPTPEADKPSPTLRDFADLFLRPREFFSGQVALGRMPQLALVLWCWGSAETVEQLEDGLVKAQSATAALGWGEFASMPWGQFWAIALGVGAVSAFFLWWFTGWWYVVRLRWCGVENPDGRQARLVLSYSELVSAIPKLLVALMYTLTFPSLMDASQANESYALVLLVFPFWSVVVGYLGVTSTFQTVPNRARLWFLILPCLVYLLVFVSGSA